MSKWRQQAFEAPSTATFIRPSQEHKLTPYHYPQPRALNCATILVNNSQYFHLFIFCLACWASQGWEDALWGSLVGSSERVGNHTYCVCILALVAANFNRF